MLNSEQQQGYVDVLLQDYQQHSADLKERTVNTIFMGGGTPSLFSAEAIDRLLTNLRQLSHIDANAEITLETNPGTADMNNYQGYYQSGINRLSIGAQSFQDQSLVALGRIHDHEAIPRAFEMARKAGFENINLDIMFGLPQQSPKLAAKDLQQAIALQPEHISWYQLTLEPNTVFYSSPPTLPGDDAIWTMQFSGQQSLKDEGFPQYEVSAYSTRPCRHNLNYWQFGDYLGIGAGAHSKLTHSSTQTLERFSKVKIPESYLHKVKHQQQTVQHLELSKSDMIFEFMLNALRLKAGVNAALFEQRTGLPITDIEDKLNAARERGLLSEDINRITATDHGYRYLNDLQQIFLDEKKGE